MIEFDFTIAAIFVGVATAVYAALAAMHRYPMRVRMRLDEFRQQSGAGQAALNPPVGGSDETGEPIGPGFFDWLLPEADSERWQVQGLLQNAGIYSSEGIGRFFAAKLCLMTAAVLGCLTIGALQLVDFYFVMLACMATGCLGFLAPRLWLQWTIRKRHLRIRRSLPDLLDLLVVCMESGLSIQGALQRITQQLSIAHSDLGREMEGVNRDISLGATVDQALLRFAERSGSEEIKGLSLLLSESRKYGTRLAESLRIHSDAIREKRQQAAEEMAQKASVKILAPTFLFIFPAVFVVLVGPAAIKIQIAFGG
ncbi:type II secretion system F family protein [Lignipirellula cremea]|uniref:Bacterial type II secretion system protein F domain protein n=1 Tax=Lignipirellula cremea TaxID=2528010 RepID=A0A518DM81_9BACT|nr:type II secretion system F family protein [Lignipirellula cremea]QDU92933.1 Bacterial type II secretion system protein F domain protein [Lignipirellula cremea]